ncbi:MAG TPA: radical SAM protein [Conexivisphaerales archaeon]|nr:radical SAM protein [Conexivisphaerales archaeon]
MEPDLLLIHPPSIYDFRKRTIFPGPVAYTVSESTDQFLIPPVGMLSIAEYLDRHGYRASVDNLGERMARDPTFDPRRFIEGTRARVYGVGLHWCVHSQGAVQVAKLCKELHPDSLVVMGGLTATMFHEEIPTRYGFVDAVLRGEAEDAFLELMRNLDAKKGPEGTPNATYRDSGGKVRVEPLLKPRETLDEYEFTRLDLLEPKGSVFTSYMPPHWSLPVCRGCLYNCASCGGSAYSYMTHLGREKPAFRSPRKLADDIAKLSEQGVRLAFLFQDPRMGGRKYTDELFRTLKGEAPLLDGMTLELFAPASNEYLREISNLGVPVTLTMSPESGVEGARMSHGRLYSNDALLKTIEACREYPLHLMVFFMLGLADETPETMAETWKLWERISSMDDHGGSPGRPGSVSYAFGPMILLDPGSLAFDFPEKYGYRLLARNLTEYVEAMELPSWHQWISYETRNLDRSSMARLMIDSIAHSVDTRERHGVYSRVRAAKERLRQVTSSRWAMGQVDTAMKAQSEPEREAALAAIRRALERSDA